MAADGWRQARIEDVPALGQSGDPAYWADWAQDADYGRRWHSLGRALGVHAFGLNANTADAGCELVVAHDELEFGGQEELYVVIRGRARFRCGPDELEVGPGEVLVVEGHVPRAATALEDSTLVLMVGGVSGEAYVMPDWNQD